jgi:Holliday junction resolvase RusA-like endonuclease
MTIKFFASGLPKGQPRPRAFAMKFGNKYQARVYDAGTAEGWKSCVAQAAQPFLPTVPPETPMKLTLAFYMPRPKAHYRANGQLKPTAPVWFTQKPDADNLAKGVMDALTQMGMWKDDSYVTVLVSSKVFIGVEQMVPGCSIEIQPLEFQMQQEHSDKLL